MRLRALLLIFAALYPAAALAQVTSPSQASSERSAEQYAQEIARLLGDASRADLSEQEAATARERAQQLALQYAAKVKARNPRGMDRFYLGYLYSSANDVGSAIAALREAIADTSLVEEDKQRARLFLIERLIEVGRVKEAEAELGAVPATAFNANEILSASHHTLAIAYTKADQLETALRHEEQSLQAARKSGVIPLIWRSAWALAQLYVALNRNADAATMLTEVKTELERQSNLATGEMLQKLQQSSTYIKSALAQLELIGKPAPEISVIKWLGEQPATLSSLKGKVVALEFWAAWCPDCRGLIPYLREWAPRYQKDGLKILTVTRYYGFNGREVGKATKEEEETFLLNFKRMRRLPYGMALDDDQRSFEMYSVTWVPTIAIIDRAGRVRFVFAWHENPSLCETMIKKILAEPVATTN